MPSSPRTPTGRRNSSGADIERPQSNGCSPKQSRRSSQYAASSPLASRSASSYGRHGGLGSPNGFASAIDSESSGGLGNLADELAEAFDEDDDQGLEEGTSVLLSDRTEQVRTTHKENEHPLLENGYRGLHPVNTTLFQPIPPGLSPSPAKQQMRFQNRRGNSQYDCSDYGEDSDLDIADGMSSSLEARLAAIESLVRRGTEANGSIADDIVQRVANHLKDLGSQSGVENSATR